MHILFLLSLFVWMLGSSAVLATQTNLHSFDKQQLSPEFWAEGACFGDFNKDGQVDIASGPFWFEGPAFVTRHKYRPANQKFSRAKADGTSEFIPGFEGALGVNNTYSEDFLEFAYDFNNDGWPDILVFGFPGKDAIWYENPKDNTTPWPAHVIFNPLDNESPAFADVTGDGKPDIICCSDGFIGYAEADWQRPGHHPWKFRAVSPKGDYQRFTHGIGLGDVNGDGRMDLIEKGGWWEQPPSLAGSPLWIKHPFSFGEGGAQMFAYDVNGDGLNDVITSLAAHGYGVAWFEQFKTNGEISFRRHIIVNRDPAENKYGVKFSQPHALALADMDGDGLKDIVTGKRFWAHGPNGDFEPNAPAVLYWFQLVRRPDRSVDFIPHLVDDNSGVGTQVTVGGGDLNKYPDLLVGNKKGVFFFKHRVKRVSAPEWEKAQPKPVPPPAAPAQ